METKQENIILRNFIYKLLEKIMVTNKNKNLFPKTVEFDFLFKNIKDIAMEYGVDIIDGYNI